MPGIHQLRDVGGEGVQQVKHISILELKGGGGGLVIQCLPSVFYMGKTIEHLVLIINLRKFGACLVEF